MREHLRTAQRHVIPLCSFVSSVVVALFLAGCTIGGAPKHPTWKNATGAEQHERLMWQAIHNKDWKAVADRLAPTFVGVNGSGQAFDRSGWVDHWKSAPIAEFSLGEVTVQPNGPDMVVTSVLHLTVAGTPPAHVRVVSVWQQIKHGWILTTTAMTPIAPMQK